VCVGAGPSVQSVQSTLLVQPILRQFQGFTWNLSRRSSCLPCIVFSEPPRFFRYRRSTPIVTVHPFAISPHSPHPKDSNGGHREHLAAELGEHSTKNATKDLETDWRKILGVQTSARANISRALARRKGRNQRHWHCIRTSAQPGQLFRQITYDFYLFTSPTLSTYGSYSSSAQPSDSVTGYPARLSLIF
jgi:hypothetical protein